MFRSDIIGKLIEKINAKKYLEIGVSNGINFASIECNYKVGVDPALDSPATIHLTSDDFFAQNQEKFDVIFIDGLHHSDQVYRDIINSLNVLSEGGYIICHDMNPWDEHVQNIPYDPSVHTFWTGDCWKAFVQLRRERQDLSMYVVDTDCGCGVIQKGSQNVLLGNEELTWENLDKNRKEWLNLISVENFLQKIEQNKEKVVNYSLQSLLHNYIFSPDDPQNNFLLGYYYESIGQTASALSFYLRTAERSDSDLLKYESLIRGSMCFDKQGTRNFTVKGMLQHAVAVMPTRPEAYYLLSRFYERENKEGSWQDSYLMASIGEKVCDLNASNLITEVDYPGNYALLFQKALSSWWCGLCDESRDLFQNLLENYQLDDKSKKICIDNL
ncbi:MAG: class I SAM-dependent methyltransferase, partial [Flavobacteriaceae bacterium]|nr:class I SAM-dependent methyltransferase [Flavobacteriaceae bacterium]